MAWKRVGVCNWALITILFMRATGIKKNKTEQNKLKQSGFSLWVICSIFILIIMTAPKSLSSATCTAFPLCYWWGGGRRWSRLTSISFIAFWRQFGFSCDMITAAIKKCIYWCTKNRQHLLWQFIYSDWLVASFSNFQEGNINKTCFRHDSRISWRFINSKRKEVWV